MSVVGRTYLERGEPVTVLAQWRERNGRRVTALAAGEPKRVRGAVRNVLIERADGERVVRPFRGLRRPPVTGQHKETP